MLTLDLENSEDNLAVHGKVTINLSANVCQPTGGLRPSQVPEVTETLSRMNVNDSPVSVNNPSGSGGGGNSSLSSQTSAQATSNITPTPTMQKPSHNIPHVIDSQSHEAQPQPQPHQPSPQQRPPSGPNSIQVTNPTQQDHEPTNDSQPAVPQRNLNPHEDEFGSLPSGWEHRKDNLGRVFYVDHNTESTTWNRPSTNQAIGGGVQRNLEDKSEPLPQGWESRMDSGGRVYYVDHNTKSTTWFKPSKNGAQQNFGPLPPGWECRMSPRGQVYYVDHNTRSTTWIRPTTNEAIDNSTQNDETNVTRDNHNRHIPADSDILDTSNPAQVGESTTTVPRILQRLYSLDTSSPDFLPHLHSLIQSDEKEQYLTSLRGSELDRLVDFLNKVHGLVPQPFTSSRNRLYRPSVPSPRPTMVHENV